MDRPIRAKKPGKSKQYLAAMVLGTIGALGSAAPATPAEGKTVEDISRYCTACWRNARLDPTSWPDCTQEVFCRLLERLPAPTWSQVLESEGEERLEFLRAIDAVKKRTQRTRRWSDLHPDAVADDLDAQRRRVAADREAVDQATEQLLNRRQKQILRMSFEGWSVNAISNRLHVPPERVSDEKYKAIRKLREHFAIG